MFTTIKSFYQRIIKIFFSKKKKKKKRKKKVYLLVTEKEEVSPGVDLNPSSKGSANSGLTT